MMLQCDVKCDGMLHTHTPTHTYTPTHPHTGGGLCASVNLQASAEARVDHSWLSGNRGPTTLQDQHGQVQRAEKASCRHSHGPWRGADEAPHGCQCQKVSDACDHESLTTPLPKTTQHYTYTTHTSHNTTPHHTDTPSASDRLGNAVTCLRVGGCNCLNFTA